METLRLATNESEVLDKDHERKQKGKDYADNLRGSMLLFLFFISLFSLLL